MFLAGIHSPWKSRCKCPIEKWWFSSHRHVRVKTQGVYLTASPAECFFQGEVCDGIWWEEGAFRGKCSWIFLHQTWGWILGQPEVTISPWTWSREVSASFKRSLADFFGGGEEIFTSVFFLGIDGEFHRTFQLAPCFFKAKKNRRVSTKKTFKIHPEKKTVTPVGRFFCRWNPAATPKVWPWRLFGGKN